MNMSEIPTGALLLVAGSLTSQADQRGRELARRLEARRGQAVDFCMAEADGEPVSPGLRARRFRSPTPGDDSHNRVPRTAAGTDFAGRPAGQPPLAIPHVSRCCAIHVAGMGSRAAKNGLRCAQRGSGRDGRSRSSPRRCRRSRYAGKCGPRTVGDLLSEAGNFARVDYAFQALASLDSSSACSTGTRAPANRCHRTMVSGSGRNT